MTSDQPFQSIDDALEAAAQKLESHAGNAIYQKAWRVAAKIIRSMKSQQKS
jgi:hypothetical protein